MRLLVLVMHLAGEGDNIILDPGLDVEALQRKVGIKVKLYIVLL